LGNKTTLGFTSANEASEDEKGLKKRTLSARSLVAFGVGAIIGAGSIFINWNSSSR
jgi:hypothetical protein